MHANQTSVAEFPRILHSRYQDGDHQVEVIPIGYQILTTGAVYTSARSLIQSLTGHPKARNWNLKRYFKLDKETAPLTHPGASILDICGIRYADPQPELRPADLTISPQGVIHLSLGLTVAPKRHLGIDLAQRAREVQKLLFHGYGQRIFAAGYDPNEVLQEVYKGILARNHGTCAWDETKSSFGHYIHMVCGCVLANFHRRESRRRSVEQVGFQTKSPDDGPSKDTAEPASYDTPMWLMGDLVSHLRYNCPPGQGPEMRLAIKLIPLAQQGLSRTEMSATLGVSKVCISKAMRYLRRHAQAWAAEP